MKTGQSIQSEFTEEEASMAHKHMESGSNSLGTGDGQRQSPASCHPLRALASRWVCARGGRRGHLGPCWWGWGCTEDTQRPTAPLPHRV